MELVSSKVDLDKDTSLLVPSPGQSCYHKRGGHDSNRMSILHSFAVDISFDGKSETDHVRG